MLAQEQARILFFNDRHDRLLDEKVEFGTTSEVSVRCRDIVRHAFTLNAPALIFVHNHPSGNPEPSEQDILFTRTFITVCKEMEITVLDHIIIAADGTCSFRERGYM